MWHSAHQQNHHGGGNDCFDPGRDRCDGWGSDRGHGGSEWHHGGGGWVDPSCHNGGGWVDPSCHNGGGWADPSCHDGGGWGGSWGRQDCHDGGPSLINFDHNSFLACH
jgi:hypothetical protein